MDINIQVQKIGKHFGSIKAVDGISFKVEKGDVLGFLGPNGAGKSTTMKMLTCFISPTFGTARVCGYDIIESSMSVRRLIGYLPESAATYGEMNVKSFLNFIAELRGFDGKERADKINRVVEITHLNPVMNQEIDTLSKGFKRRVVLAQALLHDPAVLIMDEPTDGLDPNQKQEVRSLIRNLASDKAIVLSTHILEEVDAVCTRVIIIAAGKIVANETPDGLRKRSEYAGAVDISILTDSPESVLAVLKEFQGVKKVESFEQENGQSRFLIVPEKDKKIAPEIARLAHTKQWTVEAFTVEKGRLDEVFRNITTVQGGGRT